MGPGNAELRACRSDAWVRHRSSFAANAAATRDATSRAEEFFAFVSQTAPPSSATADVYKMRPETGEFHSQRIAVDYGLWNLRFSGLLIGSQ